VEPTTILWFEVADIREETNPDKVEVQLRHDRKDGGPGWLRMSQKALADRPRDLLRDVREALDHKRLVLAGVRAVESEPRTVENLSLVLGGAKAVKAQLTYPPVPNELVCDALRIRSGDGATR
jgi:hypothetical protein